MVPAVLIVVAVLAAAIVAVVLIGRSLPVEHIATGRIQLRRRPQEVWDTLTDIDGYLGWRPGLTRIEVLPQVEGRMRWAEHQRRDKITYEVSEAAPPHRFVTRIADQGLPFGGTWTWEIDPSPEGCTVTITEHGEVYNPFFRFVSRYIIGHTTGLNRTLKALATHFGEAPVILPEPSPSEPAP